MLAVKGRDRFTGMTVPARYRGDEFVLLIVRNFSEPNFLGKKAFCL